MNKDIARYRRLLKRNLHCGRRKRRELLEQFDCALNTFLEDCPVPQYTELKEAFGPPEEMVSVMMVNITEEEREWYRKNRFILKTLAYAVLVLFVVFAFYIFIDKEYSVIVIYDELAPVQTIIGLRGYGK